MKRIIFGFFICLSVLTLAGEGIDIKIGFVDKQIFFSDSDIFIKTEIYNSSTGDVRFKIADRRAFNLDFDVRTLSNLRLEHADTFIRERNKNQPLFYREIMIGPGETYSFIENLREYVHFPSPGNYLVRGLFFPDLYNSGTAVPLNSENVLSISIKPSIGAPGMFTTLTDQETGMILQKAALPPDEVVDYTLKARQAGMWERFFLYIDLEKLYLSNPRREETYNKLSDEKRMQALTDYRKAMMQESTENDILLIPREYEIVKTEYTAFEASVQVIQKFDYDDFTEVKKYTYFLHKNEGYWLIRNYEVVNLGAE